MIENMKVEFGRTSDIDSWMRLVRKVSWNFPGLETEQSIDEHKIIVLKFMNDKRALCVKNEQDIVDVLLYSRKHNMICCLAVDPAYRKKGIASMLLSEALDKLDRDKDITVSTFRENDVKGIAPRNLYKKFGFEEDELIEEFGYPNQRFVLHANIGANNVPIVVVRESKSASSKDEFIFAIFVLNSENKLTNTREPYSLEEYVRKSEMADHTSWGDFSMGNNNPRIVSKVQAQVNSKISKEFFVEEEDTTSRLNSGLGKMFGDLLLPPENFGKKPSGGTSGGQGGSGHTETHKNVVFGYESSKTKYFANGMMVKLTIKSRRKILATGINLAIDSEIGAIKPKDWEEKMGLSMPFEIVSADIVVTKVDKLKTNLKMAVDSSNESSGISDISCELLKTKNGAGYGIHVRSDAEHLIEMELDITLQLNRKDIKPLFNVEKNEGDK